MRIYEGEEGCMHVFEAITFKDEHCVDGKGKILPKVVYRCVKCLTDWHFPEEANL